jgi:hypothetical protein
MSVFLSICYQRVTEKVAAFVVLKHITLKLVNLWKFSENQS